MKTIKEKNRTLFFIYLVTFLSSIGYAFIIYINSSFLKKFISESEVGIVYGIGSVISLILLTNTPRILNKFGHYKMMLGILVTESLAIAGASFIDKYSSLDIFQGEYSMIVPLVILSFFAFGTSAILLRLSLDLYLEKFSKNSSTGESRGIFLTVINIAIAVSPYLVGKILTNGDFFRVYATSALIFVPVLVVSLLKLKKIPDGEHEEANIFSGFKRVWKNKDIRSIFASNFLLEFFYSWMVIYTPIYLNNVMGFAWDDIGYIFSIMLLPFVFMQLPLGKIADLYIGEKEILTLGFLVTGLSTAYLSFISTPEINIWILSLFMTRVGAASIEIMNETYLFKKISSNDPDIMSFYRNAGPMAYIAGPLLASVFLVMFDFRYMFLALGSIMLYGIKFSLSIKDTK